MSVTAPWLALSVDWQDSEMFESLPQYGIEEPANMGERLAWISLLCHAKSKGRGGKVAFRKNAFQRDYQLTGRAVDGMLNRAQKCAAVELHGDVLTLCNWRSYQQKLGGVKGRDSQDSHETQQNTPTHHPPPSTNHTSPPPPPSTSWAGVEEVLFWHGVVKAGEAIGAAQAAGCSVTQVQNLIEHWRARIPAWGPGALYERLLIFKPGQPIDSLWPAKSKQAQSEESAKSSAEKTAALRAEAAESDKKRAAETAEYERRDSKFGPRLDKIPRAELTRIIETTWPKESAMLLRMLPAKGPPGRGYLRGQILEHLELELPCQHK